MVGKVVEIEPFADSGGDCMTIEVNPIETTTVFPFGEEASVFWSENQDVPIDTMVAVLNCAAEIIDHDGGSQWFQGSAAVDKSLKTCHPAGSDACAWCVWGAIVYASVKVGGDSAEPCEPHPVANAVTELAASLLGVWREDMRGELDPADALGEWNDQDYRSYRDVSDMLRRVAKEIDGDE